MNEMIKLRSGATIFITEHNTVVYSADFNIILGKISNEYRFTPYENPNIINQGYTPEILSAIADLIRMKAGIGEKRDVPSDVVEEDLTK